MAWLSPAALRRRRADGDDGVALVEFAFISPIFFLIVFAVLEFGLVYRDSITLNDAVNDAARSAAIAGNGLGAVDDDPPPESGSPPKIPDATADFVTIKRLRQGLGAIPIEWLERIVVFHATDPVLGDVEAQVPEICRTGSGSGTFGSGAPDYAGACIVYDPEEAFRAYEAKDVDFFSCDLDLSSPECNWPGRARRNDPINPVANPTYPGPDYVGVWVQVKREYLTGLFGRDLDLSKVAVVRLEPGIIQE
jgi:hypothetical protein